MGIEKFQSSPMNWPMILRPDLENEWKLQNFSPFWTKKLLIQSRTFTNEWELNILSQVQIIEFCMRTA